MSSRADLKFMQNGRDKNRHVKKSSEKKMVNPVSAVETDTDVEEANTASTADSKEEEPNTETEIELSNPVAKSVCEDDSVNPTRYIRREENVMTLGEYCCTWKNFRVLCLFFYRVMVISLLVILVEYRL